MQPHIGVNAETSLEVLAVGGDQSVLSGGRLSFCPIGIRGRDLPRFDLWRFKPTGREQRESVNTL